MEISLLCILFIDMKYISSYTGVYQWLLAIQFQSGTIFSFMNLVSSKVPLLMKLFQKVLLKTLTRKNVESNWSNTHYYPPFHLHMITPLSTPSYTTLQVKRAQEAPGTTCMSMCIKQLCKMQLLLCTLQSISDIFSDTLVTYDCS